MPDPMITLRIEHPVPSYEGWKRAFDSDPLRRRESGVRRYRVHRPIDDPNFVTLDLEFDGRAEAEAFHAALKNLWGRIEGTVMHGPEVAILETIESKTLTE